MPALSHDVEQAVQHAVGLANKVLDSATEEQPRIKNPKKRQPRSSIADNEDGPSQKKRKKKTKQDHRTGSHQELPEIVAGSPFTPEQADALNKHLVIDPALQNIRSTRSTQELVAELTRVGGNGNDDDETDVPSLAELFGDQGDSSESLLRVLSELDLPRLSNALNGFTHSNSGPPMPLMPLMPLGIMPSERLPVASGSSIPMPATERTTLNPRDTTLSPENRDSAFLLANRWMSASKLNELEISQGLKFKKGKFSSTEDQELMQAIEDYRLAHNIDPDEIQNVIKKDRSKKSPRDAEYEGFWFEITARLEMRPVIAVYHHVRRMYDSKRHQGKWVEEEDAMLESCVTQFGQKWETISQHVGRTAADCRDRWRNHLANKRDRVTGQWTEEEEQMLTKIIHGMTIERGLTADNDVFWSQVTAKMGNTRTRQQCRIKWYDSLNKKVKNEGVRPRWSPQDAYILIYKVASLNVNDESEVDWKRLGDDDWNLWSAHQLQRRFKGLMRSIKGYDTMPFTELLEILKIRQGQTPPGPKKARKGERRTNISRVYVDEEEAAHGDYGSEGSEDR